MGEFFGYMTVATLADGSGKFRVRFVRCAEGMTAQGAADTAARNERGFEYKVVGPMTREEWEAFPGIGYAAKSSLDGEISREKWQSIF